MQCKGNGDLDAFVRQFDEYYVKSSPFYIESGRRASKSHYERRKHHNPTPENNRAITAVVFDGQVESFITKVGQHVAIPNVTLAPTWQYFPIRLVRRCHTVSVIPVVAFDIHAQQVTLGPLNFARTVDSITQKLLHMCFHVGCAVCFVFVAVEGGIYLSTCKQKHTHDSHVHEPTQVKNVFRHSVDVEVKAKESEA